MITPEELAGQMVEKPAQELQDMLAQPDDWTPQALGAARAELQKRQLSQVFDPVHVSDPDLNPSTQKHGACFTCQREGAKQLNIPEKQHRHTGDLFLCEACTARSVKKLNRKRLLGYGFLLLPMATFFIGVSMHVMDTNSDGDYLMGTVYLETIIIFALSVAKVIRFWPINVRSGNQQAEEFAAGIVADGVTDGGLKKLSRTYIRMEGGIVALVGLAAFYFLSLNERNNPPELIDGHLSMGFSHYIDKWGELLTAFLFLAGLLQTLSGRRTKTIAQLCAPGSQNPPDPQNVVPSQSLTVPPVDLHKMTVKQRPVSPREPKPILPGVFLLAAAAMAICIPPNLSFYGITTFIIGMVAAVLSFRSNVDAQLAVTSNKLFIGYNCVAMFFTFLTHWTAVDHGGSLLDLIGVVFITGGLSCIPAVWALRRQPKL